MIVVFVSKISQLSVVGIDTRALTKKLREKGTMLGKVGSCLIYYIYDRRKQLINIPDRASLLIVW